MKILDQVDKFSSKQILASEKFKLFFSEFLGYLEYKLKTVPEKIDIDYLDDDFISNFKRIYTSNVPDTNDLKSLNVDEIKRILKEIINVNKNKGVIESIEYVFRTLYGYDVTVESGINVGSIEYKPEDFTFDTVDSFGNHIDYDVNVLSNEPFTFLDDPTIRGFVVTVFLENGTNGPPHLWVEKVYGTINDGDILYFPNINKYIKVLTTNKLELDGWQGKQKRFRTGYFYNSTRFNEKLFSVYKTELYGYDYLNNATYSDYSFGDVNTGSGQIIDLNLSFKSGNSDAIHEFDYNIVLEDNITATTHIKIQTKNRRVILFEVNGSPVNVPSSDILIYRLSAYEFIRQDTNTKVVDKSIIDERITRIAMFTFILHTELKSEIFMNTLRNIVLPAGYNFILLFTVIGGYVSAAENTKLLDFTISTPGYFIDYTGKKLDYAGAKILDFPYFFNRKFNSYVYPAMSFENYDKYYKFTLWADKFYKHEEVFDHVDILFLQSPEYKTQLVFEKGVGTLPINKATHQSTEATYISSITYNISTKRYEVQYPVKQVNKNHQKISTSIPVQSNVSISMEQFDKYYKFTLWADKFFTVDVFKDLPVNIDETPEYFQSLLYNIRTTPSVIKIT